MRISVRVTPRAARDSIAGFDKNGTLRVRVSAAPFDGAANDAACKLLARVLELPARDVVLISGATSRFKVFELPLAADQVRERLERKPQS